jgi:hypothetical protein
MGLMWLFVGRLHMKQVLGARVCPVCSWPQRGAGAALSPAQT